MRLDDITQAIGGTPIVRLNRIVSPGSATVYAKLESHNPAGSVKDRIAFAMVDAAERDGSLKPGMTIVEPTSGNTGIGLAMVAAAKGYKCIFIMPESMSLERRAVLKHFGAELILTPAPEGMKGAMKKADEISSQPGHYQPLQFANPANPRIHELTTGKEIIDDLGTTHLDAFVAGVGTGGTISGAGRVLKAKYGCKIIAVEPEASPVLSGGTHTPHPLQGIGAGFIPKNYDASVVDEILQVSNDNAFDIARRLAREEGILAGISSGAIVWVALQVAKKLGAGKTVVTIVCDTGERYLSTKLFAEQQ
ncbi:MAG: cysteine synthase A [Candidatus Zixiibacteriota bacterium]